MNRACGTCQFFLRRQQSSKLGTCSHPRHITFGVVPYVREQETCCRRGFGDDDWTPTGRQSPFTAIAEDRCIGEFPAPLGPRHRRLEIPSIRVTPSGTISPTTQSLAD